MNNKIFFDIDYFQKYKEKQLVGGDTFLSRKYKEDNRIISVLSDGLGSGVKANVLATLTATMALNYISNNFDIKKTARVIMKTLPICKIRKISYSTFSIVDVSRDRLTHIVEYDNPPYILFRNNTIVNVPKTMIKLGTRSFKKDFLLYSSFNVELGDRIILFSDGITQSGIGTKSFPLGWGNEKVVEYVTNFLQTNNDFSARDIAKNLVEKAFANDQYHALDDITCGVINVREPRELLVLTGPPIDPAKDRQMAHYVNTFTGKKIICGGTTAKIISRELNKKVHVNLKDYSPDIPPTSSMDGIDLITEGTITMGKVIELLDRDSNTEITKMNGAARMVNYLLNSDIIHFVVGTKINDAHQDPNVPVELEIRRNIIKRIIQLLENKHFKETRLQFI